MDLRGPAWQNAYRCRAADPQSLFDLALANSLRRLEIRYAKCAATCVLYLVFGMCADGMANASSRLLDLSRFLPEVLILIRIHASDTADFQLASMATGASYLVHPAEALAEWKQQIFWRL